MLGRFFYAYKHRKAILVLWLVVLALFAPYAAKTFQKMSVEESEYLPSNVESIEGNDLMNQLFANVSFAGGAQIIINATDLTREDFLYLQSLAEKFVEAGYALNYSSPIDKATGLLVAYGAFLSGQTVLANATISAMYLPVEVYVGVRYNVYSSTGNHTLASLQALSNAEQISQAFASAVGNRTIDRIETFHGLRIQTDPNSLALNATYYADMYIKQIAPHFSSIPQVGPFIAVGANVTDISHRRTRDTQVNKLLLAAIVDSSIVLGEPEQAIRDLFTRPIDSQEIANKAMSEGYVQGLLNGTFVPGDLPPYAVRVRLGISQDHTTAYANLILKSESKEFLRSLRDRRESLDKKPNVMLTGVNLMRQQIADDAEKSTRYLHYYDILVIVIVLSIALMAIPASVGPVLIISSAIVIAEGLLYRRNVLFGVPITQMGLSTMITAMLGAGVDYAVFMSSRYVEERGKGRSKDDAVLASIEHAGKSLLTSGGTIAIAFGVLSLSSFKSLQGMGIAVATGIATSVFTALVLMPAVLGALGDKFFRPRKMVYKKSRFHDVGRRVINHKKAVLIGITVIFGGLSYIALTADTSYDMIALMPDVPSKDGLKLLMDKFGTFMMPVIVLYYVGNDTGEIASIDAKIASVPGVLDVRSYAHPLSYHIQTNKPFRIMMEDQMRAGFYKDGRSLHIVIIGYNPYSEDAFQVVKDIRNVLPGEHYVTGVAAMYYDISVLVNQDFDRLSKIVIASIVAFLIVVFGSFLIPLRLEATVLLNIGGTLGLLYLILKAFNQPLARITPITLFVILNGLGMDYDIFLVTRIMEERSKGKSDDEAIIEAVGNTMRVITTCGIIMATSFGMLLTTGFPMTMQVGLGLALAVLFDTFIMRAFFVPAFMSLAGKRNRRAPKALKKIAVYEVE